jgi:hypothetical protein
MKTLDPEDFIWFVEDVCEAAGLSSFFGEATLLKKMAEQVRAIGALYDTDEERYWQEVSGSGRRILIKAFEQFGRDLIGPLSRMKQLYSYGHSTVKCNTRIFDVEEDLVRGFVSEDLSGAGVEFILDPFDIGM